MKPSERKYTGPLQYFHNYEHDPEGRTHCRGPESNPYRIVHHEGKHIINTEYARGHGKGSHLHAPTQWFRFTKRLGSGWDLASGEMVESTDVPASGKNRVSFKIDDKEILDGHGSHEYARQMVKNLPPIPVNSEAQARLLRAVDHGWRPRRDKAKEALKGKRKA